MEGRAGLRSRFDADLDAERFFMGSSVGDEVLSRGCARIPGEGIVTERSGFSKGVAPALGGGDG